MGKNSEIKYRKLSFQQLWKWPACGWRFFKKRPVVWVITSLTYMLIATSLGMVPIVGSVLVMLLSPFIFASSLNWLANPELQTSKHSLPKNLQQTLTGAIQVQENIIPLLMLGVFLAVCSVVIGIIGHLIAGPLFPELAVVPSLAGPQVVNILLAKLAVLAMQFFVGMWVFYAIPLIILEDVMLPTAVMKSFRGILTNLLGILALFFATLVPLIIWSFFYLTSNLIGFVGFVLIGTAILSVFINSAYCGYKLTYYQ